ncbi:MAG: hypothetical protein LC650_00805 [Actinobacteria bacterium]|nr:hypothetical protein [Actinomycetota bacterium]
MQDVVSSLINVISLSKEVHWNGRGPGFIYVHAYLDEIYLDAQSFVDEVAEYMVSSGLGVPRWYGTEIDSFPQSLLSDNNIITGLRQVRGVIDELVESLDDVFENGGDAVYLDIITRLQACFEKHLWMLTAELK